MKHQMQVRTLFAVVIAFAILAFAAHAQDAKEITLTSEQVTALIKLVQNLVDGIEAQQKELSDKAKVNQKSLSHDEPDSSENIVDLDAPEAPKEQ